MVDNNVVISQQYNEQDAQVEPQQEQYQNRKHIIMSTANDALKAKYATVYSNYYDDPYVGIFYSATTTTTTKRTSLLRKIGKTTTTTTKTNPIPTKLNTTIVNTTNNNSTTSTSINTICNVGKRRTVLNNSLLQQNTICDGGILEEEDEEEDDDEDDFDVNKYEHDYDKEEHRTDTRNRSDISTDNKNNNDDDDKQHAMNYWNNKSHPTQQQGQGQQHSHHPITTSIQHRHQFQQQLPLPPPPPNTHVIIKRGTHARVLCIERSIQSFIQIVQSHYNSTCTHPQQQQHDCDSSRTDGTSKSTNVNNMTRSSEVQIIVLGSGYDTTYFRMFNHSTSQLNSNNTTKDEEKKHGIYTNATNITNTTTSKNIDVLPVHVKWYEIDQDEIILDKVSIIHQQSQQPTSLCNNNNNINNHSNNLFSSFHVVDSTINNQEDGSNNNNNVAYELCHSDSSNKCISTPPSPPLSSSSSSSCYYIGYDLNNDPDQLINQLVQYSNFDVSVPTLLVLECVQMYLSTITTQQLLHTFNKQLSQTTCSICSYEPILGKPGESAFGTMMEQNFIKAGFIPPIPITPQRPQQGEHVAINESLNCSNDHNSNNNNNNNNTLALRNNSRTRINSTNNNNRIMMTVQHCRTIQEYLNFYKEIGFTIGIGCTMQVAYDTMVSVQQRQQANKCEFLDEYEEFYLIMKHYCILHVSSSNNNNNNNSNIILNSGGQVDTTTNGTIGQQYCCYYGDETNNNTYNSIDPITGYHPSRCEKMI